MEHKALMLVAVISLNCCFLLEVNCAYNNTIMSYVISMYIDNLQGPTVSVVSIEEVKLTLLSLATSDMST